MGSEASITVVRPREEVERLWASPDHRAENIADAGASVRFADAPGDHGTEIHVELENGGKLGSAVKKLTGGDALAKAKDDLRRFKQLVETGEIARSDAVPGGESAAVKPFGKRAATPLEQSEIEQAGV
jgi:uncharacterized membrane protein